MRRALLRRGARALVDDALDRLRTGVASVVMLHVLPSLPALGAALWWCVDLDLRGAMPSAGGALLVLLVVPKLIGWGALAAWSATAARGGTVSVVAAYRTVLARLPEALLTASLALLFVPFGPPSVGIAWVGTAAGLVALAAAVGPERAGGLTALRQGFAAVGRDGGRVIGILALACVGWCFLALNLMLLPFGIALLGGGGIGIDVNLALGAFYPDRAASWAFAGLSAALLVEAVLVVACVELHVDREAEREGTRFEAFAADLEARRSVRKSREALGTPERVA